MARLGRDVITCQGGSSVRPPTCACVWNAHPERGISMKRHLFTIASALSLLLCVAIVCVWVASLWVGLSVEWSTPDAARAWDLSCAAGEMSFSAVSSEPVPGARRGFGFYPASARPPLPDLERLQSPISRFRFRVGPFAVFSIENQPLTEMTTVLWPCWAAVGLTGIPPALWFRRRRRLMPPGHCRSCGYDLRASTGRCSECGTPVPFEAKAVS